MRGLERESKIVSLRITVTDRPGMLGEVASEIGRCGANILEVYHRRFYLDVPAKGTLVDIVIETKDRSHADETIERLRARGFKVERMNSVPSEAHDGARGGDFKFSSAFPIPRTHASAPSREVAPTAATRFEFLPTAFFEMHGV